MNQVEDGDMNSGSEVVSEANPLQAEIDNLKHQVKEKEDKYLYLYAEFDNFKKRSVKERSELIKFGWENVARDLLDILDNLKRANSHIPEGTDKTLAEGLKMIEGQFFNTIQRQGVTPIETLNKPFDPNLHEAVSQQFSSEPVGTIVEEHVKGFLLHGRLLRAAKVTVSQGLELQS